MCKNCLERMIFPCVSIFAFLFHLRNMKGIVFRIEILYRKLKKYKRPSVDETEMQRLTRMKKSFFLKLHLEKKWLLPKNSTLKYDI
jgi:hypothetical protein